MPELSDIVGRASMTDVAALAGVSAQTVSRVANGQPNVRADTRERVLAAMRELGYRPNSAARNLKAGRFRSIGFVTFNLATFGNQGTLGAVAVAAGAAGYTTTLLAIEDPTQLDVVGAFSRLEEAAVDGIILVMSAEVGSLDDLVIMAGLPVVVVDSDMALPYPIVDTDQEGGALLALDHLMQLGHRDIVHVSGPVTSFSARRRADAYRRIADERGLVQREVLVGDWGAESGLELGRRMAQSGDLPTAVFAGNDQMAVGVITALQEHGLQVPDDVSVIGFDDNDFSRATLPALTTVHQNLDAVGRKATELLLTLIDEGPVARQTYLIPTDLVVRSSTGPARSR